MFWMCGLSCLVIIVRLPFGEGRKVNVGPSGGKEHLKEQNVETACSKHSRDTKSNET